MAEAQHEKLGLKRLAGYAAKHWRSYILGAVALVATNYLTVSIPGEIGGAVDALEGAGTIGPHVLAIALMGAAIIVVRSLSRILFFNPGRDVEYQIRQELFERLMQLQPSFYSGWSTGDIVSRASNDVTYVRAMVGFAFMQSINVIIALPLTAWKMLEISPVLTGMAVIPVVVAFAILQIGIRQLMTFQRQLQEELGAISDHVLGSFQGISTIQGFVAEQAFERRFEGKVDAWFKSSMKLAAVGAFYFPMLLVAGGAATFVLLYVGGPLAIDGTMSVGDVAAFAALLAALIPPLRSLGWMLMVWQRGRAAWERIEAILDAEVDRPEGDEGVVVEATGGPHIVLKDLHFSYPDRPDVEVLRGIDAEFPAGSVVGIYGRTGSGKTTLLRVLSRLYNPPPGTVLVDGHDVCDLDLDAWRASMTLVPQRPFLFSESIARNIALEDDPDATRVDEAVEHAALETDITALQHGLDTVVGERGIMLSGGQRQRTALARGLYRRARFLLLDDVLSAVDHSTEAQLVGTLSGVGEGGERPTLVIVSGRLSALRHADVVLVMDKGKVVDRGTHAELIDRPGIYQDAWSFQKEQGQEQPA